MIYTATNLIQYLNSNKILGYKKVKGFSIDNDICILQFYVLPTIKEWLSITKVWDENFKESISKINLKQIK